MRPFATADLAQVLAIEATTVAPWSESQMREEAARADGWRFVVCGASDSVVTGFLFGRIVADEAEILKLAVAPGMRKMGVGSALLAHGLAFLADHHVCRCLLELRASNSAARRLYEKFSFLAVGLRKNYYRAPQEDALLMTKTIGEEVIS